ncbi:MAG: PhzF family phenazine biosynthesis protein [Sphingobium sp.]|uniref:PhzF family phenazine biosynthesis protein n=1 Tax=Sphingobium sp. TaxID=1912891 RepID=UPI0029B0590C|nr:PhzF family phenazine biosynthesis protein [Sphingobium sp.]MDX3909877.1 PhzF family phenazine biosynthesis protein [Sphingobium sp.]
MPNLPFFQIDAFADAPFTGNPAAVMPLEAWLPDDVLLAIAAENNLAETAFTVPDISGEADYELRWFAPLVEIALCGHATLASGHLLIEGERIRFRTRKAGVLEVRREGDGYALDLPAWTMESRELPEIVAGIGGAPVETYWRDGGYALLVYSSAEEVRALAPDFHRLRGINPGNILFMATAPGEDSHILSRVFVPGAGIDEDSVTGSAHALLTPYWAKRLGRESFTAYQASKRGGRLTCRLDGERAVLGGKCVTVIEGTFRL